MITIFLYGIITGAALALSVIGLLHLRGIRRQLNEARQRNEYLKKQRML